MFLLKKNPNKIGKLILSPLASVLVAPIPDNSQPTWNIIRYMLPYSVRVTATYHRQAGSQRDKATEQLKLCSQLALIQDQP